MRRFCTLAQSTSGTGELARIAPRPIAIRPVIQLLQYICSGSQRTTRQAARRIVFK